MQALIVLTSVGLYAGAVAPGLFSVLPQTACAHLDCADRSARVRSPALEPPGISVSYGTARLVSCLVPFHGLACANQQEQKRLRGVHRV